MLIFRSKHNYFFKMLLQKERLLLRNELFYLFKELKIISNNRILRIDKKKMDIIINNDKNLLDKYNLYVSQFRSEDEAKYCLLHLDDYINHICPSCKNICAFIIGNRNSKNYGKTCGNKECIKKIIYSNDVKNKRKKTCLERYGKDNVMKLEEFQDKVKQTNIKKYGVPYASQSQKTQEKTKKTNIEKYGVEHPIQNDEIFNKVKQTNFERYGYECSLQNEEVQEKSKKTNMQKYGVKYVAQNDEIYNKVKQTNLERYGYECSLQNKNVQEKSKKTMMERYGIKSNVQININHYDIWNDDEIFKEFIISRYKEKDTYLTLNDIASFFNVVPQAIKNKIILLNLTKYFYIQESYLEIQFSKFLEKNNIKYKKHDRSIIYDDTISHYREIDFLCEDSYMGFEINDILTHNNIKNNRSYKDKHYHYNKTINAFKKGIRLIHLWEWELRNSNEWNRLSRWIINLLNNNKIKIGARKTLIKKISKDIEKEFLNNYHLQGYMKSEICYGLYYNEELIQIMSFCKPRYNKNYQWELLRLCTKYGYNVIGGAQKLLKNFIKDNNSNSIISYCNLDKFTGKVYEQLGFKLLRKTEPQITWCNKEMKHFTQNSLNMIGADKMIGTNYGKGTNNEEIIINHGYVPIYNCGQNVYIYIKKK